ncbi:hypothetical protein [Aquipuribacter hungaricus]|uniref:Uncharacterized protein n=1 Tax=Aquipuribacter hungaricus TaxID=545624 RepID=A0ABV7WHP6_9MICO
MSTAPATPGAGPAPTVRVLAADVDRFRGSRAGLVRLLRDTAPDVVLLHRGPAHPLGGHRLGSLASDTGLVVVGGGRQAGGAAVLTSLRVDTRGTTTYRGHGGGLVLTGARLVGGQAFRLAVVDARGDDADAASVAAHLLALLAEDGSGLPTVVAGPLPGTAAGDTLASRLVDLTPGATPTSPAADPKRRLLGLVGSDADVRPVPLPGEPGRRPVLLAKVLASRPTLVELRLP